ncbi:extracellular solute-binding protein [Pseudaminobacter sp. 19-2017]|uniref:Extracellular solute-binding protein n=1 Tax=Pseudaminobacter soli (ex Zhang et al. 2022) TaxID=2831468 RepID=A0A942DWD1_9HYPH|nr:extracellular solute-binding protein [Pseudaminobacter soli]MBS3648494.1 extracellular solute-binding protein [Pseudaminobacter soli]
MNMFTRGLAAIALTATALGLAPAAQADEVTVFHDKPFYQAGWDGLTEAAKKADIDLKFSAYATDQFQAFIQQSLLSGDAPQAFTWWNGTKLAEIVESGQIAPLDELWEKKIAAGEYDASSAEPFKVNGHIYGMPTGINRWIVLYNKSLFEKAGISAPPTTWDELMATCEKLKAAGITPFNASLQEGWRGFVWFEELLIRTNPDAYVALNEGKLKYTDEPVKKVFEIWGDLYAKGYFTDPASQEEQLDFARGKAAMYLAGDWNIGLVEAGGLKAETDFGGFIMPNVDASVPNVVIVEASPLVISIKGAENPDVMKFADWYLSAAAMDAWATTPGLYAGNKNAKVPNTIIGEIAKTAADGNYRSMTRYWEASPSEIVLPAVEEMNRFMTNPTKEQAETAMKNMEAIASQYWASRQ